MWQLVANDWALWSNQQSDEKVFLPQQANIHISAFLWPNIAFKVKLMGQKISEMTLDYQFVHWSGVLKTHFPANLLDGLIFFLDIRNCTAGSHGRSDCPMFLSRCHLFLWTMQGREKELVSQLSQKTNFSPKLISTASYSYSWWREKKYCETNLFATLISAQKWTCCFLQIAFLFLLNWRTQQFWILMQNPWKLHDRERHCISCSLPGIALDWRSNLLDVQNPFKSSQTPQESIKSRMNPSRGESLSPAQVKMYLSFTFRFFADRSYGMERLCCQQLLPMSARNCNIHNS